MSAILSPEDAAAEEEGRLINEYLAELADVSGDFPASASPPMEPGHIRNTEVDARRVLTADRQVQCDYSRFILGIAPVWLSPPDEAVTDQVLRSETSPTGERHGG